METEVRAADGTFVVLDDIKNCVMCARLFSYDPDNSEQVLMTYGTWIPGEGMRHQDAHVCEDCAINCSECGERTPELSGYHFNSMWYSGMCGSCSDSHRTCERCECVIHEDDANCVGSDSIYCNNCIGRVATWCTECDRYEWNDDLCSPHDDNIHSYSYKPQPVFHGTDEDNPMLHFGFELEVEARRAELSEGADLMVSRWDDFVYLKEDSSIEFGFEIVTHPATLSYLQNQVDWSAITRLRDLGFRSWDTSTCGLHVHIDRRAFRDRSHIMAMSYLLNNNRTLSERIAGRNSDYGRIGDDCKRDNVWTLKSYARGRGGERYMAINMQNSTTIEIRMFKGSLKVERILSALEYCHALVAYSKNIRSGVHAKDMLRPEEFASWIRKQGKYPNLVQYLPDFEPSNTTEMEE